MKVAFVLLVVVATATAQWQWGQPEFRGFGDSDESYEVYRTVPGLSGRHFGNPNEGLNTRTGPFDNYRNADRQGFRAWAGRSDEFDSDEIGRNGHFRPNAPSFNPNFGRFGELFG